MSNPTCPNQAHKKISVINAFDAPDGRWSSLIVENLPYIEKQCRKAIIRHSAAHGLDSSLGAWNSSHDNELDELVNDLLERLAADDFKALRSFKGTAKITTYLTAIISNLIIDIVRSKKGRSRAKERAREFGHLGELLYDSMYNRGYNLQDSMEHLSLAHGISEDEERLRVIMERIRGKDGGVRRAADNCPTNGGDTFDDDGELVPVDSRMNPEQQLIESERHSSAESVLEELLGAMDAEDMLMLRMRYPADEQEQGCKVSEIAKRMNLNEKLVEGRLRRVLLRCREMLMGRGLSPDDLIEA